MGSKIRHCQRKQGRFASHSEKISGAQGEEDPSRVTGETPGAQGAILRLMRMGCKPHLLALLWLLATPFAALAHDGAPVTPTTWLRAWNGEPTLLFGLTLTAALYGRGVWRVWRRAGRGRGVNRWQVAAFGGGWLALVAALVSPLDAVSGVLFSAHMVQHTLLIVETCTSGFALRTGYASGYSALHPLMDCQDRRRHPVAD